MRKVFKWAMNGLSEAAIRTSGRMAKSIQYNM